MCNERRLQDGLVHDPSKAGSSNQNLMMTAWDDARGVAAGEQPLDFGELDNLWSEMGG